jgi:hypothetical protein
LHTFFFRTFPSHWLTRCTCLAGVALLILSARAGAQERGNDSIFQRFSREQSFTSTRMAMFEFPVALRPQTSPDAEIVENVGLNYLHAFFPQNRAFISLGFHLARLEWKPRAPEIASEEVKQFDLTQNINFWIKRSLIISFGYGLGLMDGLVVFANGDFEHNLVPYIPLQLGVTVPLGERLFFGLHVMHAPFFGHGPVVGSTRLTAGFGFSY